MLDILGCVPTLRTMLECASCSNIYSIVSGDPISNDELIPLKIYDVSEEDGSIYLNL